MKKIFILLLLVILPVHTPTAEAKNKTPEQNPTLEYMNLEWWGKFNDENLTNDLMELYKNNYDLKNAALKVKENEKIVKMQFANELPQLTLSGDLSIDLRGARVQYGKMRIPRYAQYNYYLPLTMSYEIDIWGTNRLKTKSIKEQLEIVKQAERATYISLTSDFASDYFNLIKADKLLSIQDELIKIQEEIVQKISDKYETGLCSINELLLEEKILTTLKEERNRHQSARDTLVNVLCVYLATPNNDIKRSDYDDVILISNIPTEYSTSIIEHRPDYLQEEANIRRIGFDVRVAKREFLPKFTILGQIGLNAYHLGSLFNSPSQFLNLGILPSIDLFSGGRKTEFLKFKKYQYEEAMNSYQKTILESIKELNSGLIEYNTAIKNYNETADRLNTQKKIFTLVNDKKQIGASSKLEVLYAKEAYLDVQKEEVSNKINSVISIIGLYKASGGVDLNKINENI